MNDQQKPKTNGQVRAIYAEAAKHGIDADLLHDVVADVTRRTRSVKALTYIEAQRVIQRLKGKDFVPLRTLQYRRQQAGVPQLVSKDQMNLIAELASQREWSIETLQKFCKRVCKREVPRTTADANKVIEALKSMNRREGLWSAA
jgi:predicted subunit of tRNA(5-methylaminomethyl-2-thiouridylate) methyltransferase